MHNNGSYHAHISNRCLKILIITVIQQCTVLFDREWSIALLTLSSAMNFAINLAAGSIIVLSVISLALDFTINYSAL
jgi:hypothetical protein